MEKRIQLEKRGRLPEKITELNLDNCRSTSVVGLTDEFVNLETLSLINVGLTSLKGFPKLPNLLKLELSDNRIFNGLNLLTSSPKLTHLNLSGNKIKDLETLQPLKEFKHLKNLDLYNNEATSVDSYKSKVFSLIPSLQYLDGFDVNNKEAESDADEDDVNGNDDDSDEEEVSTDDEEEDLDEEDVGLQAVYNENLVDDSDEGDYEAEEGEDEEEEDEEEEEDDDDDDEVDGEQESPARGKKRKHEDGAEAN